MVKTGMKMDTHGATWALADSVVETPDGLRLQGSECSSCGDKVFPAQRICGACWSEDLRAAFFGPSGTLYTYTVVPQSRPGWATPYVLGFEVGRASGRGK